MRRDLRTTAFVAGALVFFGSSTSVQASGPETPADMVIIRQQSTGATAFFHSVDGSGCIDSTVFMFANLDSERITPSSPIRTAQVALVVSKFDLCVGAQLLTGDGVATDPTIIVAPNLDSATVSAIVPVLNTANGNIVNVAVDLTFTETSAPASDNGHELNTDIPGFLINTTFHQNFRSGQRQRFDRGLR